MSSTTSSLASLSKRVLLLGRVRPRVHSVIARPTRPAGPAQDVTPDNAVVVRVPTLEFDDFFKRYFRHETDILAAVDDAADAPSSDRCREGDTVLVRRVEDASGAGQKNVDFRVEEVVSRLGDARDPFTGESVVGDVYRAQMAEIAAAYGGAPPGAFDYEKAPPRGRLEGTREFADKVTYNKWHEFKDTKDPYALQS